MAGGAQGEPRGGLFGRTRGLLEAPEGSRGEIAGRCSIQPQSARGSLSPSRRWLAGNWLETLGLDACLSRRQSSSGIVGKSPLCHPAEIAILGESASSLSTASWVAPRAEPRASPLECCDTACAAETLCPPPHSVSSDRLQPHEGFEALLDRMQVGCTRMRRCAVLCGAPCAATRKAQARAIISYLYL